MKYEMGQQLWRATWDAVTAYVTCPECGGEGRIRCITYDGTELSIECEGCRRGYDPSTGRISVYDRQPQAERIIITGFEVSGDKVEYRTDVTYRVLEADLFEREEDALAAARLIAETADREERARIAQKEKPTRTWSWHVHYHRREVREAQRRIEYHTAKLNVARIKAKEPTIPATAPGLNGR